APVDWRIDPCIPQVDFSTLRGGAGGRDGGLGLFGRRRGVVVFLPADGIGLHELGVTFGLHARTAGVRFGPLQLGASAVQFRFVGRRVDGEQQLPLFDLATLLEVDFLDDARDTRTDLGILYGLHAAWKLGIDFGGL